MKKLIMTLLAILLVFSIVSCSAKETVEESPAPTESAEPSPTPSETPRPTPSPSPTPTPSPSPTPTPSPEPEEEKGPFHPLTGLPTEKDLTKQRPLAIMLNNVYAAQPQLGVSKADLIFEVLVEGGLTRSLGVFQDVTGVGTIGSIRSSRPYYVDLACGLDAIYIHAGGSPDAYSILYDRDVDRLDGVNGSRQDIFYRDSDRLYSLGYEHSLVTTSDLIQQYLPTYDFRMEHEDGYTMDMRFVKDGTPAGGDSAKAMTVSFSAQKSTSFEYNAADSLYYASQYGSAYKDGASGDQVAVTNVVILRADTYAYDDYGRLAIDLTGSGEGNFVCGGKTVPITWSKESYSEWFRFSLADGKPLELGQGKTYFCIIPLSGSVDFE